MFRYKYIDKYVKTYIKKYIYYKSLLQELIPGTGSYKADKIIAKTKNSEIENKNKS
jgi:hypothetical protein